MPFAPHEIENKRFVVALRGYQTEEVDAFLRAVAADYRAALERADTPTPTDGEVATILRAAELEADEIRAAAHAQAEAVYAEVALRTAELQRREAELREHLTALERAVRESKLALGGISSLAP